MRKLDTIPTDVLIAYADLLDRAMEGMHKLFGEIESTARENTDVPMSFVHEVQNDFAERIKGNQKTVTDIYTELDTRIKKTMGRDATTMLMVQKTYARFHKMKEKPTFKLKPD